jgi:hypothetical protein
MSSSAPYQPLLLRLLHGTAAILLVLAWVSGFWVYETFDHRLIALGLPNLPDVQGIHGTIALGLFLFFPLFALYSFRLGDRRLIQPDAWQQIQQWSKPIWWVTIHRLSNTLMLFAVTLALFTGRMMSEEWLPKGELNNPWYLAHLTAWMVVFISLATHLLMAAKVGGVPFLLSIFQRTINEGDRPMLTLKKIPLKPINRLLQTLEITLFGSLILGLILPVL